MKVLWFLKQLSQESLTLCMFQPIPSRWVIFLNNKYRQNCEWFISVFNELIVKLYGVFLWNFRVYFDPQQCCIRIYLSIHLPTSLTVCFLYTDYTLTNTEYTLSVYLLHWLLVYTEYPLFVYKQHLLLVYIECTLSVYLLHLLLIYTYHIGALSSSTLPPDKPVHRLLYKLQTTNRRIWELCKGAV